MTFSFKQKTDETRSNLDRDLGPFYQKPVKTRFEILFLGKLLPIYILLFAGILFGMSIHHYGIGFISGILFDPDTYWQTWLVFSWTLIPTLIWLSVAVTLSYKDYARSWYIWSAALLALSLGMTWLFVPEWSSWIRIHFPVSVFCHILIYLHLSHIPFPARIRRPIYGFGAGLLVLNILTLIL